MFFNSVHMVPYHGFRWMELVEQGWITAYVELIGKTYFGVMIREDQRHGRKYYRRWYA